MPYRLSTYSTSALAPLDVQLVRAESLGLRWMVSDYTLHDSLFGVRDHSICSNETSRLLVYRSLVVYL